MAEGPALCGKEFAMHIQRICAAYFSATGTTRRAALALAGELARLSGVPCRTADFTLPAAREQPLTFMQEELVVFAVPVYAGRVPNVLLPYLARTEGGGARAVCLTVYGNRAFDDALIELRDILTQAGLVPVAAAALVGEHAFSDTLARGRPDADDLAALGAFAREAARLCGALWPGERPALTLPGTPRPYRGYYMPRDRAGTPVDIRRVKPRVSPACTGCGLCAAVCPMGSIDAHDIHTYTGICIKCGACVKKCPHRARYYDDAGYLYHKQELEEGFGRRAEPVFFLAD